MFVLTYWVFFKLYNICQQVSNNFTLYYREHLLIIVSNVKLNHILTKGI